jgi:asparagine synthase (glutamine-hydrolysing)
MSVLARHSANAPSRDPLSLIQYLDLKTYLVGDINTKVDRASMAHGLEVREPLMDHTLVEWLSTLPPGLKLRDGEGKFLLKQALQPHLPRDILYRRKMGFAVPLESWLRGPLAAATREAVLGPVLADTGWFDRACLQRLVDEHQSGTCDHSTPLWSLTMFDAFLRNALGAGAEQAAVARGR